MMKVIRAAVVADNAVQKAVTSVAIVFAALIPLLAFCSVADRHIPGVKAVWAPELMQASTLVMTMMGGAVAAYYSEHVRVTIIETAKHGWSPLVGRYVVAVSMGVFSIGMIILGQDLLGTVEGQTTNILRVPLAIPYSSVIIAGVAILLHSVVYLVSRGAQRDEVAAREPERAEAGIHDA